MSDRRGLPGGYPAARHAVDGNAGGIVARAFPEAVMGERPGTVWVPAGRGLILAIDIFGPALKGAWIHVSWLRQHRRGTTTILAGHVTVTPGDDGRAVLRFDGYRNGRRRGAGRGLGRGVSGLLDALAATIAAPVGESYSGPQVSGRARAAMRTGDSGQG